MTANNSTIAGNKTASDADKNSNTTDTTQNTHNTHADTTQDSHEHDHEYEYVCPHCNHTYPTEALVRVHVTRSQHATHANKHGFMPEITITQHDSRTGEIIEELTTRPRDWNLEHDLTLNDIPTTHPLEHRIIILTAAQHHNINEYKTLHEHATAKLEEHEHAEPVSYATTRRVIRQYFRPVEHANDQARYNAPATARVDGGTNNETEAFSKATAKQQALIVATIAHPNANNTTIANKIGVAKSYPVQVQDRFKNVINDLQNAVTNTVNETDKTRAQALVTETLERLPATRIKELHEHGLLDDINAPFSEYIEHANEIGNQHAHTAEEEEVVDKGVTKKDSPFTASPYDTTTDAGKSYTFTATTKRTNGATTPPQNNNATSNNNHDNDSNTITNENNDSDNNDTDRRDLDTPTQDKQTIPVAEIKRVRDRIEFAAEIASRDAALQRQDQYHPQETGSQTTLQTTAASTSARASTWREAFALKLVDELNEILNENIAGE